MKILPFDTETNGMPLWKEPSDSEAQPHIVQLAAILADAETRAVEEEMDVIVRPDGWIIPEEMTEIHGISHERAMDEGIPEEEALDMFIALYQRCDLRVAHNTTFDNRIVRIALKRFRPDLVSDEEWKDRDRYCCTLMNARKIMGGRNGHTLAEVYEHFTGMALEGAHNALVDAQACLEIYFAMNPLEEVAHV